MTLLETFNNYLDEIYMEPERMGVAKGEKIGKFRSTHYALLYSLYNFSVKEASERAGVSYAFLRKLRCSDSFKEDVNNRRLNFVEECLFMYFQKGHFYRYIPRPGVEQGGKIEVDDETAFDDASSYDNDTKIMIVAWLIEALKPNGKYGGLFQANSVLEQALDEANVYSGHLGNPSQMNRVLALLNKWNEPNLNKFIYTAMVKIYSEEIDKLLEHKNMTDENRKNARRYLKLMVDFSETL